MAADDDEMPTLVQAGCKPGEIPGCTYPQILGHYSPVQQEHFRRFNTRVWEMAHGRLLSNNASTASSSLSWDRVAVWDFWTMAILTSLSVEDAVLISLSRSRSWGIMALAWAATRDGAVCGPQWSCEPRWMELDVKRAVSTLQLMLRSVNDEHTA